MTSVKKIKVALLALVAALVIAIPTSAFAGDLELKGLSANHNYQVYQVFKGTLDTNGNLGNIAWGDNVDQSALPTTGDFANKSAADVADMLNGLEMDADLAKAFAAWIEPALTGGVSMSHDAGSDIYTATVADAGHYLIKDKDDSLEGVESEAYTRFIMVPGTQKGQIAIKADKPKVTKEVQEDSTKDWGATADYEIGQAIPYRITGTLPTNYSDYVDYYYKFTDKMSDGLTLKVDTVKVTVNGDDSKNITDWFTITPEKDTAGAELVVECSNLKDENHEITLSKTDTIVVTYTAVLNSGAVIGNPGNPNDVYLTFSNNPNKSGDGAPTGETPKDYCVVFTYELDNTKTGEGADASGLNDAEFVLINKTGDANDGKIAKVVEGKFVEWVEYNDDNKKEYALKSANGGQFNITGLDAGKYELEETFAPGNYALLSENVKFEIKATLADDYEGKTDEKALTKLSIDVTGGSEREGNLSTGTVDQKISNTLSINLPSTGGIGTTIFYIVGAALILAAAITMVVRRRNAAAQQ